MTTLSIVLFAMIGAPKADVARPPELTFDRRVNYVRWFNEWTSRGKKDNATPYYERILPPPEGAEKDTVERTPLALLSEAEKEQLPKGGARWRPDDAPLLAAYLEKNRQALELFVQATEHNDYYVHFDEEKICLFETEFRAFSSMRFGSQALLAQALMGPEADSSSLLGAIRPAFRAAAHARQTKTVIGHLVCNAIQCVVYEHLRGSLESGVIPEKDAVKAYTLIGKLDPGISDLRIPFTTEWASALDLLQLACPDGKSTREGWTTMSKRTTGGESPGEEVLVVLVNTIPTRVRTFIEDYYRTLIGISGKSLRQKYAVKLEQAYENARTEWIVDLTNTMFVIRLTRSYELAVRTESIRRATMLVLALHIHHDKHGEWPRTLKDIDPKLGLKGLKTYRIDTFSGKTFKYELRDGKPFLYSVGVDGKDDGGRHHPKWGEGGAQPGGDYVYWPYQRD